MAATKLGQGRDQSEFASAVATGARWRHVRWMAVAGPRWMAVAGPRWMAVAGPRWMAVAPGALWRHVRWMAVAGPRWMAVAGPRWMAVAPGALWRMGARWMEAGALRRGRETVR